MNCFYYENDLNELESLLNIDSMGVQQVIKKESVKRCLNDISNVSSSLTKKQRTQISPCESVIYYADITERRNARERNRVRQVNQAFEHLQRATESDNECNTINDRGEKKRISKLNILRRALDRIQYLSEILYEDDIRQHSFKYSNSLAHLNSTYNKVF